MEILKVVLRGLKKKIITIALLRSKKYRASNIFIIINNNNKNVTTVFKYFNKLFNKKSHIMLIHLL